MRFRAYMPLDIADGKPEQVVRVLRDGPGVAMAKMLIMPKGCPRCNGDLFTDRDWYGPFIQCLQCGWMADYPVATEAGESPHRKRRVRMAGTVLSRTGS
jgi:hypothetical protein